MKRTLLFAVGCLALFLLAALFRYQPPSLSGTARSGLEEQSSQATASLPSPGKDSPASPVAGPQRAEQSTSGPTRQSSAAVPPPPGADLDRVVQHEIAEVFAEEALRTFPLHTARAFDPLSPDPNGPRPGELWIRIKADNSREMKHIMDEVATLYQDLSGAAEPVTVIHWVGNRPYSRFEYGLDK